MTTAQAVPKWHRLPDQRPAQILSAALEVFSQKGFRGATMDEIAHEAGITKGTIYLYFPNKAEVFLAMVRARIQQAVELLPRLEFDPARDPEAQTRELAALFLDALMTPEMARVLPLVVAEWNHLPALRRMYLEEILPNADMSLARVLEAGMALGIVKKMDPLVAAQCLLGGFFSFVITQEVLGVKNVTPLRREAIIDTLTTIYFHGLLETGGEGCGKGLE